MKTKLTVLVLLLIGAGLFFYFDFDRYLSLDSLKANRDQLYAFYEANTKTMILGFIVVYIVITALSLPGGAILTLSAGAIFGAVPGTLIVNVGATIGATLAFLAARFLLHDWVQAKFGERLRAFNEGFDRNALNYILFLRLVPVFPFFLVNLASGLTRIRTRTYFFGTMFGILPGSFVYAFAGSNLASINSLEDIVSPKMLAAFALLGLFALIPSLYKNLKKRKSLPEVV